MSSRSKRRTSIGSARSRRTSSGPAQGAGPSIPTVPLLVFAGMLVVGGLVAYLIWQQSRPGGDSAEWEAVEADPAPDLPGEYVNLPEIYDGSYGAHGNNATAPHVRTQVDYEGDGNSNPPAGGPHWGNGACPDDPADAPPFCGPAPWGIYRTPWEPESLVHNTEHGGVVLWYNTTDQALIRELEDLIRGQLENNRALVVMTPYPDMEDEHIALTSWARIDKFPVTEYTKARVEEYIDVHVRRFNPEQF